ncbi:uncharacterized protein LOC135217756 isoform X2 [Macrobrachium nipponense]|uniref:uncharacterized protein LOC135217756 isoform X2 n=1 Tax=Macrobrachium nipponense TaxID=159736 RepID=UPI0030C887B1
MTASSYVFLAITVAAVLIYGLPTAYSSPNFVGHVKSVKANEGETVSFTCQIKNLSNYRQVAWYRLHPKRPLSIGTDILSGDQRLTVIPDGSMKWTLQIAKVTRHDRGKYQCAVIFSKRVSSQVASLKVRAKHRCSPRTYFVRWKKIKTQLKNLKRKFDIENIFPLSRTEVKGIHVKWCPALKTSCWNRRAQCRPSSFEMKNATIRIDVLNTTRFLNFSYLEATECACQLGRNRDVIFPVIDKAKITDLFFKPRFFPATTFNMTWERVQKEVRKKWQVSDPEVFSILRKSRLVDDDRIPVKGCPLHFCNESSNSMIPADQLKKRSSLRIRVENATKIAILEYIEPTKCYCGGDHLKIRLLETIQHVEIAEECPQLEGVTQTSYVGCNNVVPFVVPYPSEDIAWITVRRKTSPWNPLLIKSPIRNDLAAYETSDSWHKSVEYGFCDGLVEVRLRNVTYDLEDTYYCIVEFKNSSSCFSHVNLRVTEKNPGGECSFIWNPRKTVLTWNTFRQRLANVTVLDNLIPKGAEVDEAFTLQTCPTNVISCQETQKMKSCISSRFRRRLNTVCVRVPNEDDIMKLEVEYEEDDECECGIREFSQRTTNDVILAGTKLIDIKRAKHVGNCPGQCRPKRVKVKWPYIRDVITKETPYRIPPFLPGKNIWVRQCPVDSTICDEAGKKCRATGYKEKTKKILLTAYKRLFIIDYLLAKNCKCRREDAVDPHESQLFILKNFTSLPLR